MLDWCGHSKRTGPKAFDLVYAILHKVSIYESFCPSLVSLISQLMRYPASATSEMSSVVLDWSQRVLSMVGG